MALLTFTPNNILVQEKCGSELSDSKWGILLSVLQSFLVWLCSKADEIDEEMGLLGEVEAYLVMFQASIFEVFEPKSVEECTQGFEAVEGREEFCPMEEPKSSVNFDENIPSDESRFESPLTEVSTFNVEQDYVNKKIVVGNQINLDESLTSNESKFESSLTEVSTFSVRKSLKQDCLNKRILMGNQVEKVEKVEATKPIEELKSLGSLFHENKDVEDLSCQKEQKEVKSMIPDEFNKVEESKEKWPLRSGSKVMSNREMYTNKVSTNGDGEYPFASLGRVKSLSQGLESNIGSPESNWVYSGKGIGNNNLGSFGSMRVEKEWRRTLACKLFEERHNADGSEGMDMLWETYETESSNNKVLQKSNTKKGKKSEVEKIEVENHSEDEEEEEEEEEMESKLCCLQALKFSTGKMNLGMGRPNLLKFSKALKGIGWLHHVGKYGRKSNHH